MSGRGSTPGSTGRKGYLPPNWRGQSVRAVKLNLLLSRMNKTWKVFKKNSLGMSGLVILIIFLTISLLSVPLYELGLIQDPNKFIESSDPTQRLQPPSWSHLLGTDERGRDVLSQVFYGSGASLIVGFAAALLTILLGAVVGLVAGTYGRAVDEVLMRMTDLFLVIPWLPLAIILALFLPPFGQPSMTKIIIVIGITSWPAAARIVRSQTLSIRERTFIERAVSVGAGRLHIMRAHLLPNVFPILFANAILSVSYAILSAAFLAFLGIYDITKITWGLMMYNAFNYGGFTAQAWWYVLPPGICIVLVVLGFTFVSYALDDILNPKLRKR
jgi:peptide/nickel transport system permease protein